MRAAFPSHPFPFDVIAVMIIFDEECDEHMLA
jgi:hypothetical protein